jgi:hypothetical protein
MGGMKDHFLGDQPVIYPSAPGWKEPTTSHVAARVISGKAAMLRDRVFCAIISAGTRGLTPDEAAATLGKTVLAVRPRFSELSKMGRIVPTGARRPNESNLLAKAWRAA